MMIDSLFNSFLPGLGVSMELWGLVVLIGHQITSFAYPGVDMIGQMGLAHASVIKIPMLALLMKDAQEGLVDLDVPRRIADNNRVAGTGILCELGHDYMPSLRDMAKLMIVLSDNIATNEIMDVIGIDRFNQFCKDMGYEHITLMRKMMDFEAIKQGRNKLPALLPAVTSYSGVRGEVPEGKVLVANKTGDLVGIQHDVGIFQLPDGSRFIISMFTGDLEKDCEGISAISRVAETVYRAFA